ncbi:helix-turn-helix transcriptional regulator [Nonomuraea sp. FMUSA5-5]|uniref:Helix-turn-helix transcriptional regulator n=1 Tax=Nonomuraea composti TaxID=2720023 RepID=A0ABX1BF68_9ACTN|nr:helix-turn-helix transcriptional regulator [Nonomuraea sp. FMUSA5-5]NJP94411.1 helix-turn-helix transcriptional regulator [Nonomuraea sp. FMUSA5-5]
MNRELGAFLRARRSEVAPQDVGLAGGPRRRVRGLRREELAGLAGISVEYLTRLEQGRTEQPSASVLESLSRALGLTDAERSHLFDLAAPRPRPKPPCQVRPELTALLERISGAEVPALVTGHRLDVLAWNRLADALFPGLCHPGANLARYNFLHDVELYADRDEVLRATVGQLRLATGRHPDDPRLVSLIGELSVRSERFRTLWAGRVVKERTHGVKRFRHPVVGELALRYETFELPGGGHRLSLLHPADGASEESLRLLASWGA